MDLDVWAVLEQQVMVIMKVL